MSVEIKKIMSQRNYTSDECVFIHMSSIKNGMNKTKTCK